jgi:hypothetical protein
MASRVDPILMKDQGPTQSFGVAGQTFTSADQHSAPAPVTDAPAAGMKLVISDCEISCDTPMSLSFTEETTGKLVAKVFMSPTPPGTPVYNLAKAGRRKLSTAGKRLMVQTSVPGNIAITAHYYSEA